MADVKEAIESGDAETLRRLLDESPARANELIRWGKDCHITTHPLHYVSDMFFEGRLAAGRELPLVDALIAAGANVDFKKPGGETPLIGAASLGAEDVGLRLLESGAHAEILGIFQETALHWAAIIGVDRLVERLIEHGAPVDLKDGKYKSTPLGWALHGWRNPPAGARSGRHYEVVACLVRAGASVDPEWLADEKIRSDSRMLASLRH